MLLLETFDLRTGIGFDPQTPSSSGSDARLLELWKLPLWTWISESETLDLDVYPFAADIFLFIPQFSKSISTLQFALPSLLRSQPFNFFLNPASRTSYACEAWVVLFLVSGFRVSGFLGFLVSYVYGLRSDIWGMMTWEEWEYEF